jgi:hypothetical protein
MLTLTQNIFPFVIKTADVAYPTDPTTAEQFYGFQWIAVSEL